MTIRTLPAPCWEIHDQHGLNLDPGTHFPDERAAEDALADIAHNLDSLDGAVRDHHETI